MIILSGIGCSFWAVGTSHRLDCLFPPHGVASGCHGSTIVKPISRRRVTRPAYAPIVRPSIAPEKLLGALLLQALYTLRSERQLTERIDFDLLCRWFVGLGIDDAVRDASTFAKNRDRFLETDAVAELLAGVVDHPDVRWQMSRDHFSLDGTLIDAPPRPAGRASFGDRLDRLLTIASRAYWPCSLRESDRRPPGHRWASMTSFEPKEDPGDHDDGAGHNAERDFHRQKRSNATPASTTDPDAWLNEKAGGRAGCASSARRCWRTATAWWWTVARRGLRVCRNACRPSTSPTRTSAKAARWPGTRWPENEASTPPTSWPNAAIGGSPRMSPRTPMTPAQIDQGAEPRSNIDGRTTRHAGYAASQKCRKRIEEIFGPPWSPDHGPCRDGSIASCDRWLTTVACWRKSRFRGLERTAHGFHLALAASSLARVPNLLLAEGA